MKINNSALERLLKIKWLNHIEITNDEFNDKYKRVKFDEAVKSSSSNNWKDIKVEAQGDLTEFLSKNDYQLYGTYWNPLAKEALNILNLKLRPLLNEIISEKKLPVILVNEIINDACIITMTLSFQTRYKNVPIFYLDLLDIYERGHLPCGWSENVDDWPKGKLLFL